MELRESEREQREKRKRDAIGWARSFLFLFSVERKAGEEK